MKFFLPAATTPEQAETAYGSILAFNAKEMDATISPRRIYKLTGLHNGKPYVATVGEHFDSEIVIAILLDTRREVYFICTPHRGGLGGMPYLTGSNEVKTVEDFEQ